ncbi:hypothetical protein [Halobacillus amylolyticus]|uniref:Uncharacterized protein n=1 Tax=Halobacillus amylolyticus TaxID=2932259 RepID=A0ABY4HB53_9BACI|nr:hypothetical protein [Halobacillus amylolyticus]UOR11175.1 hypothetical protein MUO15_16470 [Halobacillus amylolyticus]
MKMYTNDCRNGTPKTVISYHRLTYHELIGAVPFILMIIGGGETERLPVVQDLARPRSEARRLGARPRKASRFPHLSPFL